MSDPTKETGASPEKIGLRHCERRLMTDSGPHSYPLSHSPLLFLVLTQITAGLKVQTSWSQRLPGVFGGFDSVSPRIQGVNFGGRFLKNG